MFYYFITVKAISYPLGYWISQWNFIVAYEVQVKQHKFRGNYCKILAGKKREKTYGSVEEKGHLGGERGVLLWNLSKKRVILFTLWISVYLVNQRIKEK